MKAYKGFDKNLQCRGYQYEIGKAYKTDKADLCNRGFHACEFPMDVLSYYSPGDSRYCKVNLNANGQTEDDSKRCGKKIKIGAEIGLKGIIDASIKLIVERTKESVTQGDGAHAATQGDRAHAATQGNGAHAATQGDDAHAATQGEEAHAATQGNWAHAATQGYKAHAATQGNGAHAATQGEEAHAATQGDDAHAATQGNGAHAATQGEEAHAATQGDDAHAATQGNGAMASVKGKNSIACALGINGAAKGALGCWIAVAEYDGNCNVIGGRFAMVDGEKIKEDTYYTLKNGEFVEEIR